MKEAYKTAVSKKWLEIFTEDIPGAVGWTEGAAGWVANSFKSELAFLLVSTAVNSFIIHVHLACLLGLIISRARWYD